MDSPSPPPPPAPEAEVSRAGLEPPPSSFASSSAASASTAVGPSFELGSGRSRAAPVDLSTEEASLICHHVLEQLSTDVATVRVSASSHGWVSGQLAWAGRLEEDVSFGLVAIKKGHAFVGDVDSGSELFKKVLWKLKSVNGCCEFEPLRITKGDVLVLEGPSWAIERLNLQAALTQPVPGRDSCVAEGAAGTLAVAGGCSPVSSAWSSRGGTSSSAGAGRGDFDVVPMGRGGRSAPAVPKLNLAHMHSRLRWQAQYRSKISCLCGPPQDTHGPPQGCVMDLSKCYSTWSCF